MALQHVHAVSSSAVLSSGKQHPYAMESTALATHGCMLYNKVSVFIIMMPSTALRHVQLDLTDNL